MVAYIVTVPEELKRLNLAANYTRARRTHLLPAMQRSTKLASQAVVGQIPQGVTGEARQSIGTTVIQDLHQTVGKVQSSMRRPRVYIYVLNSGRPPGKRVADSRKLEPWVRMRGLASDSTRVAQVAYLIARSIQRKGIKGMSFFYLGLERTKGQIDSYLRTAVEAITQELGKNA